MNSQHEDFAIYWSKGGLNCRYDVILRINLKLFGNAAKEVIKGEQKSTYLKYGMLWDFTHVLTLLARLKMESWRRLLATKIRLHLHYSVMVVNSTYL